MGANSFLLEWTIFPNGQNNFDRVTPEHVSISLETLHQMYLGETMVKHLGFSLFKLFHRTRFLNPSTFS